MEKPELRMSLGFSIEKARRAQRLLSRRVIREDRFPKPIKYIGGVDVAYTEDFSIGAAVVLKMDGLEVAERRISILRSRFPYIPTLLSFREVPPAVTAIRKLTIKPDILMVDGHGMAHPYRLGFASHLGLVLNSPTIGVAKRILCGEVKSSPNGWNFIVHEGEVIGVAIKTAPKSKPIYVSVGHMISLDTAVSIVLKTVRGFRLPEPIRIAHITANEAKRRLYEGSVIGGVMGGV